MLSKEYVNKMATIKLLPLDISKTSNDHIDIRCLLCDKVFNATPKSKIFNYKKSNLLGCPDCTKLARYKDAKNNMIAAIVDNGYEILTPYVDVHTKILVRNNNCTCGRSWYSQPLNIYYNNNVCRPCNDESKAIRMNSHNDLRSFNATKHLAGFKLYEKHVNLLSEQVYKTNKAQLSNNGQLDRGRGKHHLDHIIPVTYCFANNIPYELCAHIDNLRLITEKENITKNSKITTKIPNIFKDYIKPNEKLKLFVDEITSLIDIDFEINKELSLGVIHLFSAVHNIGINLALFELCNQTEAGYKTLWTTYNSAKQAGIRLITIYEDEWNNNRQLILGKLKHIFGKSSDLIKINARDMEIKVISKDDKQTFLDHNHIQGNDKSEIMLGAYQAELLLAVMTFSKKKAFSNKNTIITGSYELSRFCVSEGYNVRGIASKLLSHFKSNYTYTTIFSFCDLRWHDGHTYELMGFTYESTRPISYYYIKDGIRYHKWSFGKTNLEKLMGDSFDKNKTEREMTISLGYDRIWDCGKIKYIILV
jgi:hypothetical protein